MNKVTPRFLTSSLIALGLFSCAAFGQETPRSDKHYVGLLANTAPSGNPTRMAGARQRHW